MTSSLSKSGYYGVYYHAASIPLAKRWKAYYRQHGQQICVGYYSTKEEAAKAYNKAVKNKWRPGKFANRLEPYPLNSL